MLAAATTKPEDAISNVSGWAEILGFSQLGKFLASPLADWLTGIAGGVLLVAAVAWLAVPIVRSAIRRFRSSAQSTNGETANRLRVKLVPVGLAGGDARFHFKLHNIGKTDIQILSCKTSRSVGFETRFYEPGEMIIPDGGSIAITTSGIEDKAGRRASIALTYSQLSGEGRQVASFFFSLPTDWSKGAEIEPAKWFSQTPGVPQHERVDDLIDKFQLDAGTMIIALPMKDNNGAPNIVSFGAHGKMFIFNPIIKQAVFSALDEGSGEIKSAAARLNDDSDMKFVAIRWNKITQLVALDVKPLPDPPKGRKSRAQPTLNS